MLNTGAASRATPVKAAKYMTPAQLAALAAFTHPVTLPAAGGEQVSFPRCCKR
jgi:hypothetical protein